MTALVDDLVAWFTDLGQTSAVADVTIDRTSAEVELAISVRPKSPSPNKAEFHVSAWADTAQINLGRSGVAELSGRGPRDHAAIAEEIEQLATAAIEGRVSERFTTVAGRPAASRLRFVIDGRAANFYHATMARFRWGHRERSMIDYVAY